MLDSIKLHQYMRLRALNKAWFVVGQYGCKLKQSTDISQVFFHTDLHLEIAKSKNKMHFSHTTLLFWHGWFFSAFVNFRKMTVSFTMSVRLSVCRRWTSLALTGGIVIKFDIWDCSFPAYQFCTHNGDDFS